MKSLSIILLFALLISSANAQTKVYKLIDSTRNADIDQERLPLLNTLGSGYHLLNKAFKPKKGSFTVYRFICTFKGLSHRTEKQETFHDLIIIKTDDKSKIIDGYQYTLEWAELPFTTDLYRVREKGKNLTDGLEIKYLQFEKADGQQQPHVLLSETGVLRLK